MKTIQTNKIKYIDIKQALMDERFRNALPEELLNDVQQFLKNPGCSCNLSIYKKILQKCAKQLKEYFPTKEYESPEVEQERISKNYWKVISCGIGELESKLRSLPPGRKQIAVARYEEQITIVINELDFS